MLNVNYFLKLFGKPKIGIIALLTAFVPQFCFAQKTTMDNEDLSPLPRRGHLAVYDVARSEVLIIGGHNRGSVPDQEVLWSWNGQEWNKEDKQGPPPRTLTAGDYDRTNNVLVIHGGIDPRDLGRLGDTWVWNGTRWTMVDEKKGPSYLDHHAAAYDIARKKLVIFGGQFENRSFSTSTWEWNGNSWTERTVPGPGARGHHAMTYDSKNNLILLYGGVDKGGNRLGDMWSWDGTEWQQIDQKRPGKRSHHRMAYDSDRNKLILYGGHIDDPEGEEVIVLGDTWIWNGSEWKQRDVSGPGPRSLHAMAYDAERQRIVLFGGSTLDNDDSVWEWNGEKWIRTH